MVLAITALTIAAPNSSFSHDWYCNSVGSGPYAWHWNRTAPLTIEVNNNAANWNDADNARADWDGSATIWLDLPSVNYHTEISVFDGWYGDTGWAGKAELIETSNPCHIVHGHAKYNTYYSGSSEYKQGHLFGLDHINTGDCMGLGYYSSTWYYVGDHNVDDILAKYANPHSH